MENFPFHINSFDSATYFISKVLIELNQNRTDIYFRDKKILYLIKLLILNLHI